MASKQTRRSISVSGALYDRLKAYCEANNDTMSNFIEARTREFFEMEPRATPSRAPSFTERKTPTEVRVTTTELSETSSWTPAIELPERVDTIRKVVESKKPTLAEVDAASKIFTF